MKVIIACAVIVLALAAAMAGAYALGVRALHNSEHALCPIIDLVTRHPVPRPASPRANPSREQNYQLYLDFRQAGRTYRCR